MRKRMPLFLFVLSPIILMTGRLHGQTAIQSSTTANVFATVLPAISSVQTSKSSFGHFYPGSYQGKLVNKPGGILSVSGNTSKGGEIHYSTSFDVSGDRNTAFAISVPKSPVKLINRLNAKSLTINDWNYLSLNATGEDDLPEGYKKVNLNATLKLGSPNENPFGFYTGFYTVTFGFN